MLIQITEKEWDDLQERLAVTEKRLNALEHLKEVAFYSEWQEAKKLADAFEREAAEWGKSAHIWQERAEKAEARLQEVLETHTACLPDACQHREQTAKRNQEIEVRLHKAEARAAESDACIEELTRQRDERDRWLEESRARVKELELHNAYNFESYIKAQARVAELEAGIETWRRSADGYRVQMEEQIKRRHQAEARVKELENRPDYRLQAEREEHTAETAALEARIAELETANAEEATRHA